MKILVAGDFCPILRLERSLVSERYSEVLGDVRETVMSADYSIVNFECTVTEGDEDAITKVGPNLKCSSKGLDALKWAGFKCVTIANNHILDYGERGLENTITACKQNRIDVVGGGRNLQEASSILYKDIQGKKIAIINCCEHEFSVATEESAGANPLNPIQQYYSIKEAKDKADFVLVIVHGGHEHFQLPSLRMQETYRFFVDAGADAVVNHHQHCYSGYEVYKNSPIFYGIGNFCFDWKPIRINKLWNYGYMVILDLNESGVNYELIPYTQCTEEATVKRIDKKEFVEKIQSVNKIIANSSELSNQLRVYYKTSNVLNAFEPFYGSLLTKFQNRKWFPSLLSTRQLLKLLNLISCESHRDKVIAVLQEYIKKQ